jgi:hypothetical protein
MNSHKRRLHTGAKAHAGLERLLGINGASLTWCWCQAGAPPCLIDQPGARGYYSPMWLATLLLSGQHGDTPCPSFVRGQTCGEATNKEFSPRPAPTTTRASAARQHHPPDGPHERPRIYLPARSQPQGDYQPKKRGRPSDCCSTWGAKSMCVLSTSRSRMPLP